MGIDLGWDCQVRGNKAGVGGFGVVFGAVGVVVVDVVGSVGWFGVWRCSESVDTM